VINSDFIYQCLLKNLSDGLLISGPDGCIQIANQSFAKLIGCTVNELIGKPCNQFIRFDEHESDYDTVFGADNDHYQKGNGNGKTESNEAYETIANTNTKMAAILNSAGLESLMPVTHCPLYESDDQVNSNNAIGYLTIIYIVQADCLQQAQTEFVSTVSHELRTPLTSIKGFADTILRSGDKLDAGQQRRYVGIIKDQADRLTRLVEDLLAVSRLESKKMQLTIRPIDLQEAVERVVRNIADKIGGHRVVIDIPAGLPHVWADSDRLEQILTNLIDNAAKYSPSATTVTISANEQGKNAEMVLFSVTDQGGGIPEEHLSKIFTKFGRLDNPLVRQTEGTGLGLYITRSLVLALGGKIEVESTPGRTTFSVQLPAASLEEQAARGRG